MQELLDKRTQFSKTHQLDNGKTQLEIGGGIRHCKVDGQWVTTNIKAVAPPLNNVKNAHGGGYTHYYPKASIPIELDSVSGAARMIFDENTYICLGGNSNLQGYHMGGVTPTISRSTPNYDVEYYVESRGVIGRKWKIKRALQTNIRTFTSPIKCVGCHIEGFSVISDSTGKELANFSTAYCYEESNPWNPLTKDGEKKDVAMEISDTEIKVIVDTTDMSFPIRVDPTLTLTTPDKDSFGYSAAADDDKNYGGNTIIHIRDNPANMSHAWLQFDASAIPDGQVISSTTVSLNVESNITFLDRTLTLHRLLEDWTEGTSFGAFQSGSVSWLKRTLLDWTTAGGTFTNDDSVGASTVGKTAGTWIDWVCTAIMQEQYTNNSKILNIGIWNDSVPDPVGGYIQFHSKESASANKPKAVIVYEAAPSEDEAGPINAPIYGAISSPIVSPLER